MRILFLSLSVFILSTTIGCSNSSITPETYTTQNPDAKEILTLDPKADIFQLDGVIYQTGIEWVEELSLTKDEQVGEIKTRNDTDTNFEDGMSNKLPVGAKIYSAEESDEVAGPILLVESEGKLLKYYGLVEG
ncbi:hypothetical protein [Planococcus faecalis]|uniref:Lipoprotein n=1 Tax=Planococcus faecalis TaxID=1598147 RepID=A0ABN4XS42_9BACL|nr:hypothetical protein [Planococcus faecalis]AQU79582.1 hypothetical protein AJGP001_10075 [Planococcus faecalis]OHX53198.1 hypothetical protein BB777_11130 [Planococcus faecalis]